jgi:hypothetical protein
VVEQRSTIAGTKPRAAAKRHQVRFDIVAGSLGDAS